MWDLVPQPGIEPTASAVEAWSLNRCTSREVPSSVPNAAAITTCTLLIVWFSRAARSLGSCAGDARPTGRISVSVSASHQCVISLSAYVYHFILAPSPLLIVTGESIPLLCLEGVPGHGKKSACNVGDLGSIPGLAKSTEEGNGNPLQYSCLKSPMDRGLQSMGLQRVRHD